MGDLVSALTLRNQPVTVASWREFWNRLHARDLSSAEAAAVLASLSTRLPDEETLAAFLASLTERNGADDHQHPGTERLAPAVNIVGTGGGRRPSTSPPPRPSWRRPWAYLL